MSIYSICYFEDCDNLAEIKCHCSIEQSKMCARHTGHHALDLRDRQHKYEKILIELGESRNIISGIMERFNSTMNSRIQRLLSSKESMEKSLVENLQNIQSEYCKHISISLQRQNRANFEASAMINKGKVQKNDQSEFISLIFQMISAGTTPEEMNRKVLEIFAEINTEIEATNFLDDLRRENSELEAQIYQYKNEMRKYSDNNKKMTGKLKERDDKIKEMICKLKDKDRIIEDLEKNKNRQTQENQNITRKFTDEIALLKQNLAQKIQEINNFKIQLNNEIQKNKGLQQDKNNIINEYNAFKQQADTQVGSYKTEINSQKTEILRLDRIIEDLKKDKNRQTQENQNITRKFTNEIALLKQNLAQKIQEINNFKIQLNNEIQKNKGLQQDKKLIINENNAFKQQIGRQLSLYQTEIESKRTEILRLDRIIEDLEKNKNRQTQENQNITRKFTDEIALLKQNLAQKIQEINNFKIQLNNEIQKNKGLQQDKNNIINEYNAFKQQADTQVGSYKTEIDSQKTEILRLNSNIEELEHLHKQRVEFLNPVDEMDHLRDQIIAGKKYLKELEHKLGTCKQKHPFTGRFFLSGLVFFDSPLN